MPEPYSLARCLWIPVALEDGRRVFIRPCDIASKIDGQEIRRIATGRPDCDISLTEFLIGLLAVALPPTEDDWIGRYRTPTAPAAAELEKAFQPFEEALILDGDGPRFFQDREELEGEAISVEAFLIDAPADHFMVENRTQALSRAGAAIALLTLQTSAPAGGRGNRTSVRGGGPLTTLVVPGAEHDGEPTLWQRLWANVPKDFGAKPNDAKRVFPWLDKTRTSDPANRGEKTAPGHVHPAQAFFGMPRRIRMVFEENIQRRACDLLANVDPTLIDDVVITGYVTRPWGVSYEGWDRAHPLSPYYKPKESDPHYLPLHLKTSRAGYRDWLGMVLETQEGQRRGVPARCVTDFYDRAQDFDDKERAIRTEARLLVAGYAMDNMKPLDFGEALLPLIVTGDAKCDEAIRDIAHDWVKAAELVARQLAGAVTRALYGEKGKPGYDSTPLEALKARFWGDTEQDFYNAIRAAAKSVEKHKSALSEQLSDLKQENGFGWLAALRRNALRIFDDAAPIDSAESDKIKDVIEGRKMLGIALAGYGKIGNDLFTRLSQTVPETKKGRKAA